jgi:hypothetical protein
MITQRSIYRHEYKHWNPHQWGREDSKNSHEMSQTRKIRTGNILVRRQRRIDVHRYSPVLGILNGTEDKKLEDNVHHVEVYIIILQFKLSIYVLTWMIAGFTFETGGPGCGDFLNLLRLDCGECLRLLVFFTYCRRRITASFSCKACHSRDMRTVVSWLELFARFSSCRRCNKRS